MDTGNNKTENEPLARNDDYLWDGSGEPDPGIQRLEALLGKFRHDRPAPIAELRKQKPLARMVLLRPGNRLSITPVSAAQWKYITGRLI